MNIRVRGLCKAYGGNAVLQNFDFDLAGTCVLMGPSGCGKTTFLRLLMGLETPDAGKISGINRVAAVFQEDRLCPQLSAVGNLLLTCPGLTAQRAAEELTGLGLTVSEGKQCAAALSGGQKRRVALLRALLCGDADTLLLDEPFTGMDEPLIARAAQTILRLRENRNTILVSHDVQNAALLGWQVRQMPIPDKK